MTRSLGGGTATATGRRRAERPVHALGIMKATPPLNGFNGERACWLVISVFNGLFNVANEDDPPDPRNPYIFVFTIYWGCLARETDISGARLLD